MMIAKKKVELDKLMGSDRLSDLPDPVKQDILSFLPTKEAVRISTILSRNWQALCVGLPCLELGSYDLGRSLTDMSLPDGNDGSNRAKRESILRLREGFYLFLDQVLGSNSDLEKLKLYLPGFRSELKVRLDGWLDGAVRRGVKELDIDIAASRGAPLYSLPGRVLAANSITKLKLKNFVLDRAAFIVDGLLPCLNQLCLYHVHLDQIVLERICLSCQNLEMLSIKDCYGLSKLEISGVPRLEIVNVERADQVIQSIKIEAPSLVEFRFVDVTGGSCELDIKGCGKLKTLELVGSNLDDDNFDDLLNDAPLLESLVINHCNYLYFADIYGENLVNMAIFNCGNLSKVRAYAPKLKDFTFRGEDIIPIVFKGPAPKLIDATIALKYCSRDEQWFVQLIKLLAKLRHSKTLELGVSSGEDVIIPESVRMTQRPPLSAVKHLRIQLTSSTPKHSVQVIESLLWLAPRPESIFIYDCDCNSLLYNSLKFTYEKAVRGKKKCGCWKALPASCWRHSLDKVRISSQGGVEDYTKLAMFLEKARIDGKIECFFESIETEY